MQLVRPAPVPPTIACYPGDPGPTLRIAAVDIETTGLDVDAHDLIEVGIQCIDVSTVTKRVVAAGEPYLFQESPTRPLSEEALRILGITDEALMGRRFDEPLIASVLKGVDIVVGHRASFDRPFLERRLPLFERFEWSCSIEDVDWRGSGASSASLDAISELLDWPVGGMSALRDSQLIASMLSVSLQPDGRTGFSDVVEAAGMTAFRVKLPSDVRVPVRILERLGLEVDASTETLLLRAKSRKVLLTAARGIVEALPNLTLLDVHAERIDGRTRFSKRSGVRIHFSD